MGTKRPKRPTESKPGKVYQTGSSPTDSARIDLSYSYRVLGGVGSTSQSSRVQDGGKSQHAERSQKNVHSAESSRSLIRTFTRRKWVEVAGASTMILNIRECCNNDLEQKFGNAATMILNRH